MPQSSRRAVPRADRHQGPPLSLPTTDARNTSPPGPQRAQDPAHGSRAADRGARLSQAASRPAVPAAAAAATALASDTRADSSAHREPTDNTTNRQQSSRSKAKSGKNRHKKGTNQPANPPAATASAGNSPSPYPHRCYTASIPVPNYVAGQQLATDDALSAARIRRSERVRATLFGPQDAVARSNSASANLEDIPASALPPCPPRQPRAQRQRRTTRSRSQGLVLDDQSVVTIDQEDVVIRLRVHADGRVEEIQNGQAVREVEGLSEALRFADFGSIREAQVESEFIDNLIEEVEGKFTDLGQRVAALKCHRSLHTSNKGVFGKGGPIVETGILELTAAIDRWEALMRDECLVAAPISR